MTGSPPYFFFGPLLTIGGLGVAFVVWLPLRAPTYRAMLEREGARGFSQVAVVGDADGVAEQLRRFAEAGVTDVWAIAFPVEREGPDVVERTREVLAQLAMAHGKPQSASNLWCAESARGARHPTAKRT